MISLEEAFKKQKWILKQKINKNFNDCIKNKSGNNQPTLDIYCSCLDEVWFNPQEKDMKWDKNTFYKERKGRLLATKKIV